MKTLAAILTIALAGGCASQETPRAMHVSQTVHVLRTERPDGLRYADASAGALAFDPPVLAGTPKIDLSRDDRGPAAFVGFQDQITTLYYLHQEDRQMFFQGHEGQFTRRAYTEVSGVTTR